jgi:hypothetical protein
MQICRQNFMQICHRHENRGANLANLAKLAILK